MKYSRDIPAVRLWAIGLFFLPLLIGAPRPAHGADDADVTIVMDRLGFEAWQVVDYEGGAVGRIGRNPTLTLEVGQRYHFDTSNLDVGFFPLELRNSHGHSLLSQVTGSGVYATNNAVHASIDDDGIAFTLTDEMGVELVLYRNRYYPRMTGTIRVTGIDEEYLEEVEEELEAEQPQEDPENGETD